MYLRALMKSALPLLNKASASKAVVHNRVWGSRSDLLCHHLESTSHRAVGDVNLLASTDPLFLSSLLPGKVLDNQFLMPFVIPVIYPFMAGAGSLSSYFHDRPRLDSIRPIRSGHSCWPPPPRFGSNPGAQATPVSTGCDHPFSPSPSGVWPGLRE